MIDNFLNDVSASVVAFLGTIFASTAGYLFGRKKNAQEIFGMQADNEGKEIENADKLVHLYKDALDDLGNRYEKKFHDVTELYDRKIKLLDDEINLHKRIITQLKSENTLLRRKLKEHKINM